MVPLSSTPSSIVPLSLLRKAATVSNKEEGMSWRDYLNSTRRFSPLAISLLSSSALMVL
jgi:hypothetical protein